MLSGTLARPTRLSEVILSYTAQRLLLPEVNGLSWVHNGRSLASRSHLSGGTAKCKSGTQVLCVCGGRRPTGTTLCGKSVGGGGPLAAICCWNGGGGGGPAGLPCGFAGALELAACPCEVGGVPLLVSVLLRFVPGPLDPRLLAPAV